MRLFSDEPIADAAADYFGFAAFARALAEIIDNEETGTPLTIALSAPWGAGKTSVARMTEAELAERVAARAGAAPRVVCEFNAWEHDDAPHLGAALAARVAKVANAHRPRWRRLWEPLPAAMLEPRERWGRLVQLAIGAAVLTAILMAIPPTRDLADALFDPKGAAVGTFGLLWLVPVVWGAIYKAGRNATRFVDDPGSEASRGSIAEVKRQLGKLVGQATRGGRMVIVVDDLERCRAARAVEVFEVAGQLLAHPGVITVLLADMRSLAEAARSAYGGEDGDDPELGRRYLEKLVQLELRLPPPGASDMRLLLGGDEPVAVGREGPARGPEEPATAPPPASAAIRGALGVAPLATGLGFIAAAIALFSETGGSGDAVLDAFVTAIGVLVTLAGALFVVGGALVYYQRWRRRQAARRVEARVREEYDSAAEAADQRAVAQDAAGDERWEEYAQQVAESLRTVDSPEIETVEEVIKSYPPPFPRGAKRMVNHARLLTKIARERGMFGGAPALTPEHLGKWIVLGERWPAFSEQVLYRPALLGEVEQPRPQDGPSEHVPRDEAGRLDGQFIDLVESEPKLAEVVERLIYFEPADGDGSTAS